MRSCITMPIAIVGVGLRLPGGIGDLATLWSALRTGKDCITTLPAERWDTMRFYHPSRTHAGTAVTREAGLVDNIFAFDADFFGIARKEAEAMDPQQRLLLELAWEAMADAGVRPSDLAGSDTAVVAGAASPDSGTMHADDIACTSPYSMTGTNLSIIANRISYIFNFHGPSFTLDTACSSSLYALYQACLLLSQGCAQMALACGVNVLLAPYPFVGFSQAYMLSPEGRCKVFDAEGNGYVRSEGGGVLLLEPLEQAIERGHPIHAVIRGIDCNSDGRTQGIALPSAAMQEELLSNLYTQAGWDPNSLAYLEAHGTGTAVGDPVEAQAIGRALGQLRTSPLPIGSVKCAVGHLETASAMAGIMKALLVLKHKCIPAQTQIKKLNPAIDFAGLGIRVPLALERIHAAPPLRVGVNSFGFGGANGHVLLEEYCPAGYRDAGKSSFVPTLFLQAKSEASLRASAGNLAASICAKPSCQPEQACATALLQEAMPYRLLVSAEQVDAQCALLRAFAEKKPYSEKGLVFGQAQHIEADEFVPKTAFVFAGNGCHWFGMGRDLLALPVFAAKVREVADLFYALSKIDLIDCLLHAPEQDLEKTEITQPLLFLIQVGICALLEDSGIVPDVVFGHSVGEVCAVWAAKKVSLPDAVRIVYYRSVYQGKTRGQGKMAAAKLAPETFFRLAQELGGDVELAGINAPNSLTLCGSEEALNAIGRVCAKERHYFKLLPLDYAFHSASMESIREDLLKHLAGITSLSSPCCFLSSVGKSIDETFEPTDFGALYWWYNIRKPVLFHKTATRAWDLGVRFFLEISPHAILQQYLRQAIKARGGLGFVGSTMLKNADNVSLLSNCWKNLWVHGWPMDISSRLPDVSFVRPQLHELGLAPYPWDKVVLRQNPTPECLGYLHQDGPVDPLLGWKKGNTWAYESVLDLVKFPWIGDHKVGNQVFYPAACSLAMTFACGARAHAKQALELSNTALLRPLIFDAEHAHVFSTTLEAADGAIQIATRPYMQETALRATCRGRLKPSAVPRPAPATLLLTQAEAFVANGSSEPVITLDKAEFYARTARCALHYGPHFATVARVLVCGKRALAYLEPFAPIPEEDALCFHPALVDGGLQLLFLYAAKHKDPAPWLPYWFDRCVFFAKGQPAYALFTLESESERTMSCSVAYYDAQGALLLHLQGGRARCIPRLKAEPVSSCYTSELVAIASYAKQAFSQSAFHDFCVQAQAAAAACVSQMNTESLANTELLFAATCDRLLLEVSAKDDLPPAYAAFLQSARADLPAERETTLPPFQDLWQTLLFDAPKTSARNQLLAALHARLTETPIDLSEPVQAYERELGRDLLPVLRSALRTLLGQGPARVLLKGTQNSALWQLLPFLRDQEVWLCDEQAAVWESSQDRLHTLSWSLDDGPAKVELCSCLILGHCLHEARDLVQALQHAKASLAPGGVLCLLELEPSVEANLLLGHKPFWWSNASEDVPTSPLLPITSWEEALLRAGFEEPCVLRLADETQGYVDPSFCLFAQKPLTEVELAPVSESPWLLLQTEGSAGLVAAAQEQLTASAQTFCLQDFCAEEASAWDHLFASSAQFACIVLPLCFHAASVYESALAYSQSLTLLAKSWEAQGRPASPIILLTKGAFPREDAAASPAAAAALGYVRVLANEYPTCPVHLFDLGEPEASSVANALDFCAQRLANSAFEREMVFIGNKRFCVRSHALTTVLDSVPEQSNGESIVRLEIKDPGHLETLTWQRTALASFQDLPETGVCVEIAATGVNFRDVLWAMNLLPEEALSQGLSGACLGFECSGTVRAIGSAVTRFRVGDRVAGFASNAFATHVVTTEAALVALPDSWDLVQAATVPVTFCTAYYALAHLAHLAPGERILIHGAAGGVGMAAIQIAVGLGAEVYATAGSPVKRHMLALLGVEHCYDSRSLSFREEILADTGGEGVDCVLNSLAGEAMNAGLSLLKPFGRFLELGKNDFYADSPLRLRPFRQNISYFGIDLDQLMRERPDLGQKLLIEVMDGFAKGLWAPLPATVYEAPFVEQAFRAMQASKHIGKLLVLPPKHMPEPPVSAEKPLPIVPKASYLVSGGTSGFGLATARFLLKQGAESLVLVSRRGRSAATEADLAALCAEFPKAQILVKALDIADSQAVSACLREVKACLPPLKGIIHAAAVLDDALIANLNRERIARVLLPKIAGAVALDQASRDCQLDFFIVYSSVTTLVGNPGQANYVAANAVLEALMAQRRANGLPGLALGWGAIADVGMLARDEKTRAHLTEKSGIVPVAAESALGYVASCQALPATSYVFHADWRALARLPIARDTRLRPLIPDDPAREESQRSLFDRLAECKEEEAHDLVLGEVCATIARILRTHPSAVVPTKALQSMGLDSLMGVELGLALEELVGGRFSMTMSTLVTPESITAHILAMAEHDESRAEGNYLAKLAESHGVSAEAVAQVARQRQESL